MDQSHQHRPATSAMSTRANRNVREKQYRKTKRRQLIIEQLEDRRLLSGYYTSRAQFLADAQIGPTTTIDFDTLPV